MELPDELQLVLAKELEIEPRNDGQQFYESMCAVINRMIEKDFSALTLLLYRIDVDEEKLKHLLQTAKDKDAAPLIADLIIERQLEKLKFRKEHPSSDKGIDESEKW